MKLNELPQKAKYILVGYMFWVFIHSYLFIANIGINDEWKGLGFYPFTDIKKHYKMFDGDFYDFSEFFVYTGLPLIVLVALYILVDKKKLKDENE